jgi:hypothetical protein
MLGHTAGFSCSKRVGMLYIDLRATRESPAERPFLQLLLLLQCNFEHSALFEHENPQYSKHSLFFSEHSAGSPFPFLDGGGDRSDGLRGLQHFASVRATYF